MNKLKTSSRISLNFMTYVILILVFFSVTVNLYYLYSWTTHSKEEISEMITKEYSEAYKNRSSDDKFEKFKLTIMDLGWYIIKNDWKIIFSKWYDSIPNTNILNIFEKEWKYYLIWWQEIYWVWKVYVFYDTYSLYQNQITLMKVTLLFLVIFSIISYFVANYFTIVSLAELQKITKFAKELDFNNLNNTLEISWPDDDEIKIIANTLNEAINKIDLKAQRLKYFSSDVAHEFKTSLMIMNSEIDYCKASGNYKEWMTNIKVQVKFLDYLISSLLSLTRLEANKLETTEENIWDLISWVFNEARQIFENKWLNTNLKLEKNVNIKVNKWLFLIVLNNLVFNAFKYTNSWKIEVILNSNSISIKDSWIWIPKENLSKIWTRFYKEDISRTDTDSHWLGLALVEEIIKKHKFKIEVDSEISVWSTFTIYFNKV